LKTLFTGELFNSFWCSIGVHLPGGLIEIEDELSRNHIFQQLLISLTLGSFKAIKAEYTTFKRYPTKKCSNCASTQFQQLLECGASRCVSEKETNHSNKRAIGTRVEMDFCCLCTARDSQISLNFSSLRLPYCVFILLRVVAHGQALIVFIVYHIEAHLVTIRKYSNKRFANAINQINSANKNH